MSGAPFTRDVSVVICAYNAAARIERAIEHIARQQCDLPRGWELVIVDNRSTDNTHDKAAAVCKRLWLPVLILKEHQPGKIHALRRAARAAQGRLLCLVDDDNLLAPDYLANAAAFFESHPRAALVGGRIEAEFEDPSMVPADFAERFAHALAVRDLGPTPMRLTPPAHDPPPGAGSVVRTALLRQVLDDVACYLSGPQGNKLSRGEDSEIGLVLHHLGWQYWYEPSLSMKHVLPASRLTTEYLDRLIIDGSESYIWLQWLRGAERRRSRVGYAMRGAALALASLKQDLLFKLRNRPGRTASPPDQRLWFYAAMHRAWAISCWRLALDDPFSRFEASITKLCEQKAAVA